MRRLIVAAFLVLIAVVVVGAQSPSATPVAPAGLARGALPKEPASFTFCRLIYRSVRSEALGSGWTTDYPSADQNLMIRLSEVTKLDVSRGDLEEVLHAVVRSTDKNVFRCPFLFASDIGTVGFLDDEVTGLREYLLKGGFLWVDDFWGQKALDQFRSEMMRVLPEYEMTPIQKDHPIYKTFFTINEGVPQVPAISFWLTTNGLTSERGGADPNATLYGIFDGEGRLMVVATHNTDIADGWEREAENVEYFHTFSPISYAVGVNVVMWAMTH
jgi:hypothetical protein